MQPNLILNGLQMESYLKSYNIDTGLGVLHYNQLYSLDYFVNEIDTNLFYEDREIVSSDFEFSVNTTDQEIDLIITAFNKLRKRVM